MVTLTRLLTIKIVANNRSEFSNKELIFLSEGWFLCSILLKSDGESEKNAISEPETKPETSNNIAASSSAISAIKEGVCTVTPLKTSANWHKYASGSNELVLSETSIIES